MSKDAINVIVLRLFGPLAKEFGKDLKKWYVKRRDNAEKVISEADRKMSSSNAERVEPDFNVIYPILEKSSLVDNEFLQGKWSNLLMSSVSKESSEKVHVSFPHILEQLVPMDVKILDFLYDTVEIHNGQLIGTIEQTARKTGFFKGISDEDLDMSFNNLVRLQLCCVPDDDEDLIVRTPLRTKSRMILITEFGMRFVECCKG